VNVRGSRDDEVNLIPGCECAEDLLVPVSSSMEILSIPLSISLIGESVMLGLACPAETCPDYRKQNIDMEKAI